MKIEKSDVWIQWNQDESASHHTMAGNYIIHFDVSLKTWSHLIGKDDTVSRTATLGKSTIQITDESWIPNKGDLSLIDHVHYDFNDELNWNEYTVYEYLEDGLKCVRYGQPGEVQGTIAFIHKIEILPEFRGNKLFETYMNLILSHLKKIKVDYVSLQPHPFGGEGLEEEQMELGKLMLRRFYSKFGFEEISIEKGTPYMVLPMKLHEIKPLVFSHES